MMAAAPTPRSRPAKTTATEWVPLPMQERALACGAYELFLGGAAGPGKSEYLVVAPLRWVDHPAFRAILFRNSFPELERTLVAKSRKIYPGLGGTYNESKHVWVFPSGAQIEFAYLESDRDVHRYQGAEFCFVGFDELPHFTEYQYRYMQSRMRSASGLPMRLRATGNPDGPHLEWVRARFVEWIEKRAAGGDVLWFDPDGQRVAKGVSYALSRSYIPGRLDENPYLGPEYRAQLMALDPVTRARLLEGDWDACAGEGKLFHRTWWRILESLPDDCEASVRAWDFGATVDGDPTQGVRMHRRPKGIVPRWVIDDVRTLRGAPHEVEALVKATAELDGKAVVVVIPQDPGQAGLAQVHAFKRLLNGWRVVSRRPSEAKIVRWGPFSSQVGALNVGLVRAAWNRNVIDEGHAAPDGAHDDFLDAASDAHAELSDEGYAAKLKAGMKNV